MLEKHPWFRCADDLHIEILQLKDEGKDVSGLEGKIESIAKMEKTDPKREELARAIYAEGQTLEVAPGYPYIEPSTLDEIRAQRPEGPRKLSADMSDGRPKEKLYGAWLGRCSGCLLGKPVEGWRRNRIREYAEATGNWPLSYYLSSDHPEEILEKFKIWKGAAWVNNVDGMPEDDDTNYTILGLKIMETYGIDFKPADVAESWLGNLPILHVCTAERVAYKNLVDLVEPPESALYRNPYREWIGAQIRADFFGYAAVGNPELAADFAWRDASISHIKNGIYGEMWVAAMLAAAYSTDDVRRVIEIGLTEVPAKSRFAEAIHETLKWYDEGITFDEATERFHGKWNEASGHDWCHTISNAVIVTIALLWGGLDFEKTITYAVSMALDTDCNGATAGSVVGMILGASKLPDKWIKALNDQVRSGVDGFQLVKISNLAERTVTMAKKVAGR